MHYRLICTLICSVLLLSPKINAEKIYYNELKAYKKDAKTRAIFDRNAHPVLSGIQQDIDIYKELSLFQRFVRSLPLLFDVIIVTPETLPTLHNYAHNLCTENDIQTPTIFVTRKRGFFNAFAQKFLMSSGAIVIGQQIMKECTDQELEAVIAHELGHIKHNHVNKMLCLTFVTYYIASKIIHRYFNDSFNLGNLQVSLPPFIDFKHDFSYSKNIYLSVTLAELINNFIINKRFEKEADLFACQNHKAHGLIGFCKHFEHKDVEREEQFTTTYDLINDSRQNIDFVGYLNLKARYCIARVFDYYTKAFKWVYYNTFYGAHPSPQARIQAAQEYLEETK